MAYGDVCAYNCSRRLQICAVFLKCFLGVLLLFHADCTGKLCFVGERTICHVVVIESNVNSRLILHNIVDIK